MCYTIVTPWLYVSSLGLRLRVKNWTELNWTIVTTDSATHCNAHCNTLRRTYICAILSCQQTLQHTATRTATHCNAHIYVLYYRDNRHCNTHCNTLQRTYICVILSWQQTLQHTLQHTATHIYMCYTIVPTASRCTHRESKRMAVKFTDQARSAFLSLQHTATHCNTLQHTATHCNTLEHTKTEQGLHLSLQHNTQQHAATHCNTLQHTVAQRLNPVSASLSAACCSVLHCVVLCHNECILMCWQIQHLSLSLTPPFIPPSHRSAAPSLPNSIPPFNTLSPFGHILTICQPSSLMLWGAFHE